MWANAMNSLQSNVAPCGFFDVVVLSVSCLEVHTQAKQRFGKPGVQKCPKSWLFRGFSACVSFAAFSWPSSPWKNWETDFLPLLVLTRRRSTGKNQHW